MKDLISIIVPVYKVEKYLSECIESIINQSYKNIEIILINDGSPDKCGEICEKYAKKDKRIRVIHKENGGVSIARNTGIEASNGKYITFVDSDDYIDKDYIYEMYKAISKSDAQLVICNYNFVSKKKIEKNNQKRVESILSENAKKKIFRDNDIDGYCWNKLFLKEKLLNVRFNNEIKICEDLLFIYEYLDKIKNVCIINSFLYNYRLRRNSALNTFNMNDLTVFKVLNKLFDENYNNLLFKNFYCYFYIKYRKYLKNNVDIIKYNFTFLNILYDKEITNKNKILNLLYCMLPNFLECRLRRLKQVIYGYFE